MLVEIRSCRSFHPIRIAAQKNLIEIQVQDLFFGEGEGYEQYNAIDKSLRERNESLVIVELGFAAPLGDWFASLGDTPAFRGGVSLASIDQLLQFTSCETLPLALSTLRMQATASWVLLVDRYPALPKGEDALLPPTEFRVDVVAPNHEITSSEHKIAGHPDILHARVAKMAMAFLRQQIAATPD